MKALLLLAALAAPAFASVPPYFGQTVNTAAGTAAQYLSGVMYISASSGSTASPTITLNGTTGVITITGNLCAAGSRPYVDMFCLGADPTGATDATSIFQTALNTIHANGGGRLYATHGTYKISSPLVVYHNTTIFGDGTTSSVLAFTNTGAGLVSSDTVNSSFTDNVNIRDIELLNNNGSNVDGGFVQIDGSYINLFNVTITGFKYSVIYDQTEIGTIILCNLGAGTNGAAVWLVNGSNYPNYGGGSAQQGYTNQITIANNQINMTANGNYGVMDEGGTNHHVTGNNFEGATYGMFGSAVNGFEFDNNEVESSSGTGVYLDGTEPYSGTHVGPSQSVSIHNNSFNIAASTGVFVANVMGGAIYNNTFGNVAGIFFSENPHRGSGLTVSGNVVNNANGAQGYDLYRYLDSTVPVKHILKQAASTVISAAISAGSQQVFPGSMVGISTGTQLLVVNSGGQNVEVITVASVQGSSFTATFANSHPGSELVQGFDSGGAGGSIQTNQINVGALPTPNLQISTKLNVVTSQGGYGIVVSSGLNSQGALVIRPALGGINAASIAAHDQAISVNQALLLNENGLAGGSGVGIGMTTIPSSLLDVNGSVIIYSTLTVQGANFSVGGSSFSVGGGSVTAAYQMAAKVFSGAGTSLTGTAASLTCGNVTTNANLTGPVTSVGNATSFAAAPAFTGIATFTNAVSSQAIFSGWDPVYGASGANGSFQLGTTTNGGSVHFDGTGASNLTIANTTDNSGASSYGIKFQVRTSNSGNILTPLFLGADGSVHVGGTIGTQVYSCSGGTDAGWLLKGNSGAAQTLCTGGGGSLTAESLYIP